MTSLTVRPWFDIVNDLQSQAFAIDTPSQRQQLLLDGKRLKEDGRVLAQHGVVEECTIQLVSQGLFGVIRLGKVPVMCCFEDASFL